MSKMNILGPDLENKSDEHLTFQYHYCRALRDHSLNLTALVVDPDNEMSVKGLDKNKMFLTNEDNTVREESFYEFDLAGATEDNLISLLKMVATYWGAFSGMTFDNIDALDTLHGENAETVKYWILQMLRRDYVSGDEPFKHYIEFNNDKRIIMRCHEIPEFVKERASRSLMTTFITHECVETFYKEDNAN